MPLTAAQARSAAPTEKAYKLADGGGLYLWVSPTGAKSWRMKYRYGGKEKVLTFGLYGDVSLAEAREMREAAKRTLRANKGSGNRGAAGKAPRGRGGWQHVRGFRPRVAR